ncbi:FG-GAP and VCBS repeat-containing protein [Actinomadura sp. GTD37]|uniref:FG-GAP and VCBS repeat-containing protein n=1 Tax=Actinomadura sp. GTD37 TaxID=1778030 RepID=UPI0035BF261E
MNTRARAVLSVVCVVVLGGTAAIAPVPLEPQARPVAKPARTADFNGDGRTDLVLPMGGATVEGMYAAGLVAVVYGSDRGPDVRTRAVFTRDSLGTPGAVRERDWFGYRVAPGDFDGDGYADLAFLQSSRTSTPISILYGGPLGLGGRPVTLRTPEAVGLEDMAAGDFDGDGRSDLVAADDARLWSFRGIGAAPVAGTPADLGIARPRDGEAEVRLVVADFTGDGRTDLALKVTVFEAEDDFGKSHGELRLGTPGGLSAETARFDRAGTFAGDVDGDGRADLIAEPDVDRDSPTAALRKPWAVVYRGTPAGLAPPRAFDVPRPPSDTGAFAVGDVNGDGRADIASGDLDEPSGGAPPGGHIDLRISGDGTVPATTRRIDASSPGMPWIGTARGRFGDGGPLADLRISLADLNGDGKADLTIGAPAGWPDRSGVVSWLPSTPAGPATKGAIAFGSRTLDLAQVPGLGDYLVP